MENRRFAAAYEDLPEKNPPSNPERRELLAAPRKWMRFFDDTMHGYLSGEPVPDEETYLKKLHEYAAWNYTFLPRLMKDFDKIDNPSQQHNDAKSEFAFHQLNGPTAFLWYRLLYYEKTELSEQYLTNIQLHMASRMAPTMQRLVKLQGSEETTESPEHQIAKGILSEADTAIVMMEMMKTHPELVAVPAPQRYENNRRSWRNADQLLIDTERKNVRGIQVKTNSVGRDVEKKNYDRTFVSIVDSKHELGNSAPAHNSLGRISLPGQIAMGLLSDTQPQDKPSYVNKAEFMRSRQIAKELVRNRRSYLAQATLGLTGRLVPELAENASALVTRVVEEQYDTDKIA